MVKKALSWPARQIAINAGEDGSVVVGKKASSKTSCRTGSLTQPRWSARRCRMRPRLLACSSLLRRWSPRDPRRRHPCPPCRREGAWITDGDFEVGNLGGGLWHQRVTARLGDQDRRAGGVFLDLLPQPVDVCLERVSGEPGIVAPDFLQQCLARYRTLASTTKISQDAGLLLREPHLVTLGIEQEFRARPERAASSLAS